MYIIILILILILIFYNYKYYESYKNNQPYLISIFLTENHCQETDNLLTTLQKHNLLNKVIITCLDQKCFNYMQKWKIKVNLFNSYVDKEADYSTVEFRKIVINKLKILDKLLKKYKKSILHIDTDVVVLSNQLDSDIKKLCNKKFDMIFQSDHTQFEQTSNKCTGFMLLNYTKNTLLCLKKSIKLMKKNINNTKEHWGDQKTMNYIINTNSKKYKTYMFNSKSYPNGYRYFNNLDTIYKYYKPIIVHNNYIKGLQNKIIRFKKHNLWFLP